MRKNLIINQIFGLSVWSLEIEIDDILFQWSSDLLVSNESMRKKILNPTKATHLIVEFMHKREVIKYIC